MRAHNTYLRLSKQYDITFEVICSSVEFTESKQYSANKVPITRVVSPLLRTVHDRVGKGGLRTVTNAAFFHFEAQAITKLIAKKDFDLIHVFGYSPATVAAINWTRNKGVPLMLEIVNTGMNPYQYLPGTSHFRSYDLAHQSVIVAISEHIADLCNSLGLSDNVWTRPNPVDSGRFKLTSDEQRANAITQKFEFEKTDKVIVYVAKFLKRKNHGFLIEVLKELPDQYKLVLAGPPLPKIHSVPGFTVDDMNQLIAKAEDMKVLNRLVLQPQFVDYAEYLKSAHVTCFPSVREGMGTPLLESLAAGVPVVANGGESSFREHIVDHKNGYLRPLDAKQWADAIVKAVALNPKTRQQFSEEAINKYSTQKIDADYFKLMTALNKSDANDRVSVSNTLNDNSQQKS